MNGDDGTSDQTQRIASLAREARADREKLEQLFAMVADRAGDPATRRAALRALQQLGFTSSLLKQMNAQLVAALRSVIDDPDEELRTMAIQMLAQQKDEFVQRRLLEGLQRTAEPLVSDTKAIQFLGYDIHAGHFPIVRQFARESPDPETRREAVKLLAADTESAGLLFAIFDDKSEDEEVRRASGGALLSVAPQTFEQRAKEAVLDDSDAESVRASSLTALTHFADPIALANDRGFIEGVANVETRAPESAGTAEFAPMDMALGAPAEGDLAKAVRVFKERYGVK
jgi:HEAT repeat protein